MTVVDDFAHHPTAIRETLRALRERYPGRRLWAVLEPRSNTLRRNVFAAAWWRVWRWRIEVVLAAVFKSESIPVAERLVPEDVVARLNDAGTPALMLADADAIVAALAEQCAGGGCGGDYVEWRVWWDL